VADQNALVMQALSVQHLSKTYGQTVAVADVSFEVEEGEIFGIIGPNGSGKTTTVECLQGLRQADGGTARVFGIDPVRERMALRELVGSQLQESALPDRMKVGEALDLFAALSPNETDWRRLSGEWGLDGKENDFFSNLSGGQQQRLFVALSLVNSPKIVFLDEMTTGLDPAARRVAWDLVKNVRAQGTTVVLVTHFMDEAEFLCNRIAVFKAGRLTAIDTPSRLISSVEDGVTVRFTSEVPALDWLSSVRDVTGVTRNGSNVEVHGRGGVLAYVGAALVEHGLAPEDLSVQRMSLEDAYLKLTDGD
jgi:ABC-2 type transport system ATP-binding protein